MLVSVRENSIPWILRIIAWQIASMQTSKITSNGMWKKRFDFIKKEKRKRKKQLISCASATGTKTFQQRAENSCAPLRTPARILPCKRLTNKTGRKKCIERKREKGREKEGGREEERDRMRKRAWERKKTGAFYFEFRRPLNKFALTGTVNRQKIYWSSRALIGDVYHAAIFSSWNTARTPLFCQSLTPLFLLTRPHPFDVASNSPSPSPSLSLFLILSFLSFFLYVSFLLFLFNFSLPKNFFSNFFTNRVRVLSVLPARRNCRDRSTVLRRSAPSHECFRAKSS